MKRAHDLSHLIDRIRQIIDDHAGDQSRDLAEAIVKGLRLKPESVSDVRQRVRYVSALFDDELTKLEGAE